MARDNYFDNDGDIVSKKSVTDSIKPVFSSLLAKINEQKAAQARERAAQEAEANEARRVPDFPEDILELINADAAEITAEITEEAEEHIHPAEPAFAPAAVKESMPVSTADAEAEKPITVAAEAAPEPSEDAEDIVDAIKSFSHRSGERLSTVAHSIKENTIAVAAVIEEKERTSSKARRALVIFLMLLVMVIIFVGFIFVFMQQMNRENEKISRFNTAAGEVCADYVKEYGAASYENLYTTYGVDGYRLTGICFVRELDFDDDGSSELMITYNKNGVYFNEVWGFNDNKEFAVLLSERAAQTTDKAKDAYSTLYRKNNKYYIGVHHKDDLNKIDLYQLKGEKFSKRYDCVYDEKTQAYAVDGKDDTTAFERIKYSVFKGEKAIAESEKAEKMIESFSGGASVSQLTAKQSRKNAYYSIVQDYNKRYGTAKYVEKNGTAYVDGLAVVDLIDFDGDGKNELLLVYRKPIKVRNEAAEGYSSYEMDTYYCEVYRYTGSKAVLAYTSEGLSDMDDGGKDKYFVIKKDGKKSYYCTNSFNVGEYGRHITATSSMYAFDGTSFNANYSASYETDYGYTEYYLDGKEVSKSTFDEDGYQVALFGGDSRYDENIFKVVYVQRSTSDKGSVSGVPGKTEKMIQKLNPSYSAD